MPDYPSTQATPEAVLAEVLIPMPLQKLVGAPVQWLLTFESISELEDSTIIFFSYWEGMPVIGGQVAHVTIKDAYPFLSSIKKGDTLLVAGNVWKISEQYIGLDISHLSVQVSKDNGDAAPEPKTDEKAEEIASPFHRRFSNEQLGGGVLIIVIVEIILGATGHWDTPGVKLILAIGILWTSYWTYAELRYKRKSNVMAFTLSFLLGIIGFGVAATCYSMLGDSQPAPRPPTALAENNATPQLNDTPTVQAGPPVVGAMPVVSPITPDAIMDRIQNMTQYQIASISNSLAGTPVRWRLPLFDTNPDSNPLKMDVTFREKPGVLVSAVLLASDAPFLKAANVGDIFIVSGEIGYVRTLIFLDHVTLIPVGKSDTGK